MKVGGRYITCGYKTNTDFSENEDEKHLTI